MDMILGIDIGGTYTDGVLIDYGTKQVIRGAKVPTTWESLVDCISGCIDRLTLR